ncbi:hypothetical protein SOVF_154190 isoform B [Spinacia oleracea]|nr:hypothetical protein SOVF_154190 isoform B [Spinacia oleracea]
MDLYCGEDKFYSLSCSFGWKVETDMETYLLRQHFFRNLHDRLSARPFLSLIEKKWLAFQISSHDLK